MSAPATQTSPAAYEQDAVLTVRELGVAIGRHDLLHDVSFTIGRGERVGLIGESGSGKSLTSLALLGLLPEDARVSGSVRLEGVTTSCSGPPTGGWRASGVVT